MIYKLTEINIYPIKSCGGISVQSAEIEERGLQYDRRWMLVDEDNMFMTQRKIQQMALINVDIKDNHLIVTHSQKNLEPLSISIAQETQEHADVVVWNDEVKASIVKNTAEWFSEALELKCKLVYMHNNSNRFVDKDYAKNNEIVSFADGYPFLIIGEESLNHLNSKLDEKLPMNRFRPNFVFSGGGPHVEDKWKVFTIGGNKFFGVKPCARCVVTTIDQKTGTKNIEPLKTLSTYRLSDNKIKFGQNLLHEGAGIVNVGDEITVLEMNY